MVVKRDPGSYPLKGATFFVTNPPLWGLVIKPLIFTFIFSLITLILLFAFAYVPQVRLFKDKIPEWAAYLIGLGLVLTELFIATAIFVIILFSNYEDKLFDKVLEILNKNIETQNRVKKTLWERWAFTLVEVFMEIITVPLAIIPVLGTMAYCFINGFLKGWSLHHHYFELKGLNFWQQYHFVTSRKKDYTIFGGISLFLAGIPILGFLLCFTNSVGAALWAVDLEDDHLLDDSLGHHNLSSFHSHVVHHDNDENMENNIDNDIIISNSNNNIILT